MQRSRSFFSFSSQPQTNMASDKRANRDEVSEDNLYHSKWSGSSGFFLTLYLMIAKLGIVCNSEALTKRWKMLEPLQARKICYQLQARENM